MPGSKAQARPLNAVLVQLAVDGVVHLPIASSLPRGIRPCRASGHISLPVPRPPIFRTYPAGPASPPAELISMEPWRTWPLESRQCGRTRDALAWRVGLAPEFDPAQCRLSFASQVKGNHSGHTDGFGQLKGGRHGVAFVLTLPSNWCTLDALAAAAEERTGLGKWVIRA